MDPVCTGGVGFCGTDDCKVCGFFCNCAGLFCASDFISCFFCLSFFISITLPISSFTTNIFKYGSGFLIMEVYFATSNKHKVEEATKLLGEFGVTVKHFPFVHNEIRSDSLEEIACEAVAAAHKECKKPVFVEDTGLFIEELNGFPGTFSGWALKKIGTRGILKLLQGSNNRSAYFETCIAYTNGKQTMTSFGRCDGSIANEVHGSSGFGYDPIFVPTGYDQTFAESITLKNKLSHRYKSLLEFSKLLTNRR